MFVFSSIIILVGVLRSTCHINLTVLLSAPYSGFSKSPYRNNGRCNSMVQVTEKKVKQVKNLNVDPGARGNGSLLTNSMLLNPKGLAPRLSSNGGPVTRSSVISQDFVFPPGGIPSLHLPSVVVRASCFQVF